MVRSCSKVVSVLALLGTFTLLFAAREGQVAAPGVMEPGEGGPLAVKKEALRYDGKSFAEWRAFLLVELNPKRREEALAAMAAFSEHGFGKEAAEAVIAFVIRFDLPYQREIGVGHGSPYWVLCSIGQPAVPALLNALNSARPYTQLLAIDVLADLRKLPSAAAAALLPLVSGKDDALREAAILALHRFEEKGIEPELTRLLKDGNRRKLFIQAVSKVVEKENGGKRELGYDGSDFMDGSVSKDFTNPSLYREAYLHRQIAVRLVAATLLSRLGPPAREAIPALLKMLKEHGQRAGLTRSFAADALGAIQSEPEQVVPALVEVLKDDEVQTRQFAIRALGRFGKHARPAVPALNTVLKDPAPQLRFHALLALGRIGEAPRTLAPAFVSFFADTPTESRGELLEAIPKLGADASIFVPGLIEAFGPFQSDRKAIALALGQIGSAAAAALPALGAAREDRSPEVRQAVAEAIRLIEKKRE